MAELHRPGQMVKTSCIHKVVQETEAGSFDVICMEGKHFPPGRSGQAVHYDLLYAATHSPQARWTWLRGLTVVAGRDRMLSLTDNAIWSSGPLANYNAKRNFDVTPEPAVERTSARRKKGALSFVIQKHWASSLHYDFRLEAAGVLLSWAVPKGPSYDPESKRLAVRVEDHPLGYASFEGTIPANQYGAGDVIVWDRGTWEPVGNPAEGMTAGKLVFRLHGEKLAGMWELVRISKQGARQDKWLLFKKRDEWARPLSEFDVVRALPDSVVTHPLGLVEQREPKVAGT